MKAITLSVLFASLFLSCIATSSRHNTCQGAILSREDLMNIVDKEIEKRGGHPDRKRKSSIEIKREGCDYIYHETYLPARPGSDLYVRINQNGEVVDFFPGL